MKQRLCKRCREQLGVDWAQAGLDDCGTCNGSYLKRLIRARPKQITAGSIGNTDGWENRRGGN